MGGSTSISVDVSICPFSSKVGMEGLGGGFNAGDNAGRGGTGACEGG
jgi:hypothetical protein